MGSPSLLYARRSARFVVNLNLLRAIAKMRFVQKNMTFVRGVRAPRLWNLDHLEHGFAHDAVRAYDDVVAEGDKPECPDSR